MTPKRVGVLAAATVACVLAVSSVAWACVSAAEGPYVNELFTQKVSVGQQLTIGGHSWTAAQAVQVGWRATSKEEPVTLASAVPDSLGVFSAQVQIPTAPAGYYYLIVTQGLTTRPTQVEVLPSPGSPAATPTATPAGSGQLWNGLRAGSATQGLTDMVHPSSSPQIPVSLIVVASLVAGLAVLGLLVMAEQRRAIKVRTKE
jgi:hypothetical protein